MNKIFFLLLILFLFIGQNVCLKIGIDSMVMGTFILLLAIIIIIKKPSSLYKIAGWIPLFLFITIYCFFKLITDTGEGTRSLVLAVIAPPILLAAVIIAVKDKYYNLLIAKKIFYYFYIIEIGIAIVERILGFNIFPWNNENLFSFQNDGITDFRSTGLHGHPLQNALIVSTLMMFILISNLNIRKKIILWGLGFFATACFNTRAAMVGNFLLFTTYILHSVFINKQLSFRIKKQLIFISILLLTTIPIILYQFNLGGRLLKNGLNDGSSQVRIAVWSVFDYFPINSFLLGFNFKEVQLIMYKSGLYATENFWIDWVFRFGLLFIIPLILLYTRFLNKLFIGYKTFYKIFITVGFFLIASSNNSLSVSFIPLSIFLIAIKIYNPKINTKI